MPLTYSRPSSTAVVYLWHVGCIPIYLCRMLSVRVSPDHLQPLARMAAYQMSEVLEMEESTTPLSAKITLAAIEVCSALPSLSPYLLTDSSLATGCYLYCCSLPLLTLRFEQLLLLELTASPFDCIALAKPQRDSTLLFNSLSSFPDCKQAFLTWLCLPFRFKFATLATRYA